LAIAFPDSFWVALVKHILPLAVLGVIAADYLLTGTSKPVDITPPTSPHSVVAAQSPADARAAFQASFDAPPQVVEVDVRAPVATGTPVLPAPLVLAPVAHGTPEGLTAPRADIAANIDRGAVHLDAGMRQLPGYVAEYARSIERHGLKGFLYDDPELKRKGAELGAQIGNGIRELAIALGKDLTASVQEAQPR
jgi:hypothetical protein